MGKLQFLFPVCVVGEFAQLSICRGGNESVILHEERNKISEGGKEKNS